MDIAAEIIGVNPLKAKLTAFAVSSFFVGISGALFFAVYLGAVEVGEVFGIQKSFLVLFMIIIGLGSILAASLAPVLLHAGGLPFWWSLPVLLKLPAPRHPGTSGWLDIWDGPTDWRHRRRISSL